MSNDLPFASANEWNYYTTVQVKSIRHKELIQAQIMLQAREKQLFDLRDVIDRVLVAGLDALNTPVPANGVPV